MAAVIGALRAELSATIARFQEDMKNAGAAVREFATKAEAQGKRLQRVGAQMTVALTAPLVAFGVKAVQAATESAQALGQLDAALKSTEFQAGRTLKQLQAQAKALESISTFDDDDILKDVTTNLTKFGNVVGTVFDKAQVAIVNMASRTGDLAGAAQTVGRALNDPIQGITALTRAGVQFTTQEKEKIKALVTSGRGIEAQAIILGKLETAFAGAAKAARDASPTADFMQSWREFMEVAGALIAKILGPLTSMLKGVLDAFNTLSPEVQRAVVYTGLFVAALGPLVTIVGTLMRVAAALAPIVTTLAVALGAISAPVWATVAAITALVGALVIFWRAVSKLLQGDFTAAWEEAKKTAREMWNDLVSMFASKPIQAPVELIGPDGKSLTPGKTNFNIPRETGGDGDRIPEVAITRPRRPDEFSAEQLADAMNRAADALRAEAQRANELMGIKRQGLATEEAIVDLDMRRGEGGFISDEMIHRLEIARDLENQKLDAEARLTQLRGERIEAEFNHDQEKVDALSKQIILEERLMNLAEQTTVEMIRREERLQQGVADFTNRVGESLKRMARDGEFTFEGLRMALRESLFEAFVDPAFDAAMEALGQLVKSALKALFSGGFAEGGFVPPGQWAVVGERGPEPVFGGKTGLSVMSNEDANRSGAFGGNTTVIQNIRTADTYSFQRTQRQLVRSTKRAFSEA